VKRRNAVGVAGQFLLDALSGRLGVPMMVMGYVAFAVLLLGYVSIQVYTNTLMESVTSRKRTELALQEHIGILTAEYATMTSKSRISHHCEEDLGLVTATSNDVVRVRVDPNSMEDMPARPVEGVGQTIAGDVGDLTQVIRR
jgi:hypothetical protein